MHRLVVAWVFVGCVIAGCGGEAVEPSPPAEAGDDATARQEFETTHIPLACRGALPGRPCDDSFLDVVGERDGRATLSFSCDANNAADVDCRPRLDCIGGRWQHDGPWTGPDSPSCTALPSCEASASASVCVSHGGALCRRWDGRLQCGSDGYFAPLLPQAGSRCAEEGFRAATCDFGVSGRRCVGGVWVRESTFCF